ncbi:F-box-like domain superfamily [Arabidopsis suecica]|uniref:F-box-like domain superfamily n=1 Tax=Arabidopsis suecica TaxID=45249 RepID=A0A8T2AC14_ARASU|nr:F-box-like domain superfamily [Arabidopsis suecica]
MDPPLTESPSAQSMKGRFAIQGCSQLELKTTRNETGLLSLPDEVAVDILAQVSRLDLVALAMVSRRHRFVSESHNLRALRFQMGSVEPYLYVFMQMYPDPSPRWFVLHPVQRLLKPVHSSLLPAPEAGSCFVPTDWGIYMIGGLVNGKPTSEVRFFDCINHTVYRVTSMKMARSGASASLIDKKKIYVFGGCWDVADSSNWVEVFDMETGTWDLLFVFTPKMPLKIQQSVALDDKNVYAVDEDGQIFSFSPSNCMFVTRGIKESNPESRNDWLLAEALFCRGVGGRILWRFPNETVWKEVKGLEELQQQHCGGFDIIKLFPFSAQRVGIFWEARPQGPDQILELWYAELSLFRAEGWGEVLAEAEEAKLALKGPLKLTNSGNGNGGEGPFIVMDDKDVQPVSVMAFLDRV